MNDYENLRVVELFGLKPGWLLYYIFRIYHFNFLHVLMIVGTDTPTFLENSVSVIASGYEDFTFSHNTAAHRLRL